MSERADLSRPAKRHRHGSQALCDSSANAIEDVKMPRECDRRVLRSHYRRLKSSIAEEKGDLVRSDSHKFDAMVERVESLHLLVYRPREQIADAEALFDITEAFLNSVKDARRGGGIRPADFVSGILQRFGQVHNREEPVQIDWGAVGLEAISVFHDAPGLCTMLGPMDSEPKKRKAAGPRRRDRAATAETARPELVGDEGGDRTETDKNIRTMFNILRKCGTEGCQLEHLVLNRNSFAESVENIFFLSFLVKDGRAQISIQDGKQIVAFRYAPSAEERSGRRRKWSRKSGCQHSIRFQIRFQRLGVDEGDGGKW